MAVKVIDAATIIGIRAAKGLGASFKTSLEIPDQSLHSSISTSRVAAASRLDGNDERKNSAAALVHGSIGFLGHASSSSQQSVSSPSSPLASHGALNEHPKSHVDEMDLVEIRIEKEATKVDPVARREGMIAGASHSTTRARLSSIESGSTASEAGQSGVVGEDAFQEQSAQVPFGSSKNLRFLFRLSSSKKQKAFLRDIRQVDNMLNIIY